MTILSWPAGLRNPSSISGPSLRANTQSGGRSPFDGTEQTLELPGARWVAELRWDNLPAAQWRILMAFIASLRGQSGRFTWGPSVYIPRLATGDANPGEVVRVRTASQTGATLSTTGWDGLAAPALAGDYIGFLTSAGRPQLHMVTADVAAVEPQSTNFQIQSTNIIPGGGTWIIGSTTTDLGAVADPWGGTTARRLSSTSLTGTTNTSIRGPAITMTPGGTYTFSTYVRLHAGSISGRYLVVTENDGSINTATPFLNLSSGGVGSGWTRVSRTLTLRSDTIRVFFNPVDTFNSTAGTVLDIAGPQAESRGSITSYIPTTTTAAQRTQTVDIPISPPLRRSPNINEPLILTAPTAVWKLAEDMVPIDFTQRGGPVASVTMGIEEAIWG